MFGNSTRRPLSTMGATPGPANYSIPSVLQAGPKYHIVGKGHLSSRENAPGPGAYSPRSLRKRAPTFAIGTAKRDSHGDLSSPGPTVYDTRPKTR